MQQPDRTDDPSEDAVEQTEQYTKQAAGRTATAGRKGAQRIKETACNYRQTHTAPLETVRPEMLKPPTPQERMKRAAIKEKQKQAQHPRRYENSALEYHKAPVRRSYSSADRQDFPQTTRKINGRTSGSSQHTAVQTIKTRRSIESRTTAPTVQIAAKQHAQRRGQQKLIQHAQTPRKTMSTLSQKFTAAISKAMTAITEGSITLIGGAVLVLLLCMIVAIGAVIASPFGIFFANSQTTPGTIPLNAAVAQINAEFADILEELQEGEYDSVEVNGQPPDWREVIAVFASKTAGADDGVDVAVLDTDRVDRLRAVFWDMTALDTETETITDERGTSTVLHITIAAKTANSMRTSYHFTKYQNDALTELMDNIETLGQLLGDLTIRQADAVALLESLPEDLSPERRTVIKRALSLVGKVNYFWGGKSYALGWDSRWGTTTLVTSLGSSTTGTYQPYGLDCSGFVDWVYYNASGGTYLASHGGGAQAQHNHCTPIRWTDALPGDLVFYPGDSHVGIVGGYDPDGNLLIIHCASGWNNVIITDRTGFTSIGRPDYYE